MLPKIHAGKCRELKNEKAQETKTKMKTNQTKTYIQKIDARGKTSSYKINQSISNSHLPESTPPSPSLIHSTALLYLSPKRLSLQKN